MKLLSEKECEEIAVIHEVSPPSTRSYFQHHMLNTDLPEVVRLAGMANERE